MTLFSRLICACAVVSVTFSNMVRADPAADDAQAAFDALATHFPALNAVVLQDGDVAWSATGGASATDSDGLNQRYNIYSIAKMITGAAYHRLEQTTGLDLNQAITAIDPELDEAYQRVTLRHLLGHTAGLRHYRGEADWRAFNDRRCVTPADALPHFISDPLTSEPGDRFQYTTFGFALLSHLLVKITGAESFDAAMAETLGDAYGFETDRDGADKATPYLAEGDSFQPISLSAECKFGGGGLIGSAMDLARFGEALTNGIVAPSALKSWTTKDGEEIGVAYGMSVGFSESMATRYALHSGGSPGGRGFLLVLFEPKIVVALTANSDGPNHADTAVAIGRAFAAAD